MSAWVKQDSKQVKKHGKNRASWYCEWNEPDGTRRNKSCGPGRDGKRLANQLADKITAQLKLETYESEKRKNKNWASFRKKYEQEVLVRKSAGTYRVTVDAFNHFERICNPKLMRNITSDAIDDYVSTRLTERGLKRGDTVSPATVNKELRCLKAALRRAKRWKHLDDVPDIEFLQVPGKLIRYMTPEHFAEIYKVCDAAKFPVTDGKHYSSGDWWRALLTFTYMTGWRIGEPLALKRDDLDMENGTAITRAKDNKGKRDDLACTTESSCRRSPQEDHFVR